MSGKTPPIRRKLVILRIPPIRPSADPPSADPFLCKILMRRAICRPKLPSTEPQELRRSESSEARHTGCTTWGPRRSHGSFGSSCARIMALGLPRSRTCGCRARVSHAREIEHATTLMYALNHASYTYLQCGDFNSASALAAELDALADEKGAAEWKAQGLMTQGALRLLTGKPSDAVRLLTTGVNAFRLTGATVFIPRYLTYLATAYTILNQYDDALRVMSEATEAVYRTNAGARLKSHG